MDERARSPNDDRCVSCGEPVPEGRQVCHHCETDPEKAGRMKGEHHA